MAVKRNLDIIIIADVSNSLKRYATEVTNTIRRTVEELQTNPYLSGYEICLSIISFAQSMHKIVDFAPLNSVRPSSINLTFGGQTNPAPAIEYATQTAMQRYENWKLKGLQRVHPIVFFFTDGEPYPEDNMASYKRTAARVKELSDLNSSNPKMLFTCVGFGNASIDNMAMLTDRELVLKSNADMTELVKVFPKIVGTTTTNGVTNSYNQIKEMFRNLFSEE